MGYKEDANSSVLETIIFACILYINFNVSIFPCYITPNQHYHELCIYILNDAVDAAMNKYRVSICNTRKQAE